MTMILLQLNFEMNLHFVVSIKSLSTQNLEDYISGLDLKYGSSFYWNNKLCINLGGDYDPVCWLSCCEWFGNTSAFSMVVGEAHAQRGPAPCVGALNVPRRARVGGFLENKYFHKSLIFGRIYGVAFFLTSHRHRCWGLGTLWGRLSERAWGHPVGLLVVGR